MHSISIAVVCRTLSILSQQTILNDVMCDNDHIRSPLSHRNAVQQMCVLDIRDRRMERLPSLQINRLSFAHRRALNLTKLTHAAVARFLRDS